MKLGHCLIMIYVWCAWLIWNSIGWAQDHAYYYSRGKKQHFVIESQGQQVDQAVELGIRFASGVKARVLARVIVGLQQGSTQLSQKDFTSFSEVLSVEQASFNKEIYFVNTFTAWQAIKFAQKIYNHPRVKYAHPVFLFPVEARSLPWQEPLFDKQWHLRNTGQRGGIPGSDMKIYEAWQLIDDHNEIKVGLIDLGFEQDHPDLQQSWAINLHEQPDNKIDDDHNGYIDDWRGWNFDIMSNRLIYGSSPKHGTATAGIIGAQINQKGVSGVCPYCRIIPMVIYNNIEHAIRAFYYARDQGAYVISNSWGYALGTPEADALVEAIHDVAKQGNQGRGIHILFAMPNRAMDVCRDVSSDISAHPDVIAISSVDNRDIKVKNSAYGNCLKLVGPSSANQINGVVTTDRQGNKGYNYSGTSYPELDDRDYTQSFYGTSAATPAIAGVFALLWSQSPSCVRADDLLRIVIETADKVDEKAAQYDEHGFSRTHGYGRPNALRALQRVLTIQCR